MDCEAPIPAPAPCVLADLTAQRSWDEGVSDQCRQLHEWNADTVRLLVVKNGELSRRCELVEAELAKTLDYLTDVMRGKEDAS